MTEYSDWVEKIKRKDNLLKENNFLKKILKEYDFVEEEVGDNMTEKERFIIDDAGTLIDLVTGETYDIVEEVVDVLNYYENTVLRYQKIIRELKDGTYTEELPITQRK